MFRVRCSELHHPHIVRPKSLIRTSDHLCIVTEYANGGDLFRMVRRGGDHGLPGPAARFLFQQLILALEFCHEEDIYIRNINPSNLLIFWNDKGMPILKLSDFRVSKNTRLQGSAQTPVVATMYTCPHMIRQAGRDRKVWEDLAPVCDVWAAVVTLYFLLTGRWPFSYDQITGWATTGEQEWNDDAQAIAAVEGAGLPADVVQLFREVFAGGRLSAKQFPDECSSIESIIGMTWFQEDLPPEMLRMTTIARAHTQASRHDSHLNAYMELQPEAAEESSLMRRSRSLASPAAAAQPRAGDATALSRGGCHHSREHTGAIGADWHVLAEGCDRWCSLVAAHHHFVLAHPPHTPSSDDPFSGASLSIPPQVQLSGPTRDPSEDLGLDAF